MTPRRVLAVLAVAQLCGMAPWFSASAVAPALTAAWRLRPGGAAWLTISVQLGFVAGALVSAALTLSDRWSARRLAAAASLGAAVATLAVAFSRGPAVGIAARVATGAALAGVYPPGMKIAAGWFRDGRGWAIGMLVGALTVGSAAPHLMRWLVPAEAWRLVLVAAAVSALLGAALMLRVPSDGPYAAPSPPFSWTAAPRILRDRAVLLANAGYLGHMWELYAMWTWTASFVAASETVRRGAAEDVRGVAALITFCVVGIGAMGCWLGGRYADRLGRTTVTSAAMAASGACALAVGVAYGRPLWVLVPLLVVWGVGDCRFRSVLGGGKRAGSGGVRRDRPHAPDQSRVSAHGGHDLLGATGGAGARLAVEHEHPRRRPGARRVGDASAQAAS